ncbi:MAG: alpha/beta hydrolase [Phreatobacter sp.]|uniref:alpha/beta fold hydrolase n=1 Tax=Phreatobacter sp. TaxID=1966341 RepID=UPI001A5A3107|nr:alpha/beta hydrolase [Phreatobacter sp.]MBL8567718.1 alpha/beta hydrolase [Phreatobacter sp.]
MPKIAFAGGELNYTETGSGRPLLLVHGSPGEARAWNRVLGKIGEGYRILVPDLPGYGASSALPPDRSSTAAMAEAVAALAETVNEPLLLAGHSYGGNVSLHVAAKQPRRLAGLAVFEPVFFRALELQGDAAVLGGASRFFAEYVSRVASGEPDAIGRMIDFWSGSGAFARLPDPVRAYLRSAAPRNARDVSSSFSESVAAGDLRAIGCPVSLAYGSKSPPVAPAIIAALSRLLPDSRTSVIEGADHGMLDSHPQAVADIIRAVADA